MPVRFERLLHPTPDDLAQIKAIYDENFPPVMQKPFDVIRTGGQDDSHSHR